MMLVVVKKDKYAMNDVKISRKILSYTGHNSFTNPIQTVSDICISGLPDNYIAIYKNATATYLTNFSGKQLVHFYPQIVDAIRFINSCGIVHANIQPKNIEVHDGNTCLITGFDHSLFISEFFQNLKYLPDNYLWPIEMHIACYMSENGIESLSEIQYDLILENHVNSLKTIGIIPSPSERKYLKRAVVNRTDAAILDVKEIDLYSLKVIYFILLKDEEDVKIREFLTSFRLGAF